LPPPVGTPKNWQAYHDRFVEPVRINAGMMFWQAHAKTLARAEQMYGVPAKILVGIIGVETLYGRNTGNFRVIDSLATLAFDFPQAHPKAAARQAFFRDELGYFLAISHQNGQNPLLTKGSYAGAIGLPQFMPSSIAKYAVDFDGDGKIDLQGSVDDVIGSVAHYFQAFNWQPGLPTHYPVSFDMQKLDMPTLMGPDILPTFDVSTILAKGVVLTPEGRKHPGKLALIELQNGAEPPSYFAGTENFYAITRYNWSSYYAMAVIDLADAVAQGMQKRP
jgi:membrane-bound lytic murein transglycosylase B